MPGEELDQIMLKTDEDKSIIEINKKQESEVFFLKYIEIKYVRVYNETMRIYI